MTETDIPRRANAYFDVQNLFKSLKEAWGVRYNEYDPIKLASAVAEKRGWLLQDVYYYTGTPRGGRRRNLERFWGNKLPALRDAGVKLFTPGLKYDNHGAECPNCHGSDIVCERCGRLSSVEIPREKTVDVRIALDLVLHSQAQLFDAAIVFSQDQDLQEAVKEAKNLTLAQGRQVTFVSAFPAGCSNAKAITYCSPYIFTKELYTPCIDPDRYSWPEYD